LLGKTATTFNKTTRISKKSEAIELLMTILIKFQH